MPVEQKGCCRGSKGCKDQLLVSKAIQECKSRKKNVSMAWVDYQKAFGSVPHSWIIISLELIGINNVIIPFTKKAMSYWKTSMHLLIEGKIIETEDLEIQCGIFHGDLLSPLLFCINLIALTERVNKSNTGYEEHMTKTKVSHLLYMDDLKLVGKTEEELQKQMQVVRTYSDDIHMEFGLDKCAEIVLKTGKLVQSQNVSLDFNREIQELKQGKTYKYIGIEEGEGIQHQ